MAAQNIFWEMIQKRCEIIGLMISRAVEKSFNDYEAKHAHPVISKFLNLIDLNFKEERSVAFYAERLHISANYLNIISKKKSPHLRFIINSEQNFTRSKTAAQSF